LICAIVGASSILLFPSVTAVTCGVFLSVALFLSTLFFDWVVSKAVLNDPIFVLRRTVALSYFGWFLWFFFIELGVIFGLVFNVLWWVKFCLFGFAALLTLRAVVFFAVSSAATARRLTAVLLQPLFCVLPFVAVWLGSNVAAVEYVPFLVISPVAACGAAAFFVHVLDRMGQKMYDVSSMTIFKAFMLNWVSALNEPLEAFFERLGKDEDVEVSFLKFDASKPKAAVIVPSVHPGPFKNIGSSLLPSMLKRAYEEKYGGDACVPLGLLGHELDAASQAQNHKIINHVLGAADFLSAIDKATQCVTVSEGFVTASCQLFGRTALLSFTLAPKTTEDLPQELGGIVLQEAERLGLEGVVVVNAHNSLTSNVNIEASLESLRDVASRCLQKAVSMPLYPFEVGAATVYPKEFTLKDGMGAGGITALVVNVAGQKTAYVVIDGNNMVSGLRERVLSALHAVGFQEGEVFTTDTHAVSAVVLGQRGYHPVGEVMDQEVLINHIKAAAKKADSVLEPCRAGTLRLVVPKVRVIGEECLTSLTVLVDKSIQKAKRLVVPIFAVEGLLLFLLLALV
ncbi:MAG: DUF2070 family protein, partial [Candidatus Bathyarchaeia archaeon]